MVTRCKNCGAFINTKYGADAPALHQNRAGTADDPRAPGDHDDVCDYDGDDEARSQLS